MNERDKKQNELKKKLIEYLNKNGIKQRFIAKQLYVHEATISRFIKRDNYYLSDNYYIKLKEFLKSKE